MAVGQIPRFSVSDFLASLNQTLEYTYPGVEVEGEVASFKVNQGKWVFFDLKDAAGSVNCFMPVFQLRVPIEDGMKVVVKATPKVTKWGRLSLTIQSIRPRGEGSLKKSFDLLKVKLDKEGLFAPERKRLLPSVPQHIAVVSSTQAAGYADFVKILNERWGGLRVDVAHVQVQGDAAPEQIIHAIHYFNEQEPLPEVLVIIRGGGSADDLATFNDEPLVRAIAASRIPTLVGVGHEVDVTLADMVADVRAATPSNAAQIVVPDRRDIQRMIHLKLLRAGDALEAIITENQRELARLLERALLCVDEQAVASERTLTNLAAQLKAYNPEAVLARGYAIIRGRVMVGKELTIERQQDIITAEVTNVSKR